MQNGYEPHPTVHAHFALSKTITFYTVTKLIPRLNK